MDYNIEREIKDMQDKIEALEGVISDIDSTVMSRYVKDMQAVVDEWTEYTRPCLEAFAAQEEEFDGVLLPPAK